MTVESWDIATLLMDANVMIDLRETNNYDMRGTASDYEISRD